MIQTDNPVHGPRELGGSHRPAFAQGGVVNILHPDAGQLAENVEGVEEFLQVHHFHLPFPALLGDHVLERVGGAAMAAARIEKNQVNGLHSPVFISRFDSYMWRRS